LKSRTALVAASPNGDVFRLEVTKHPAVSIMIYTRVDEPDIHLRARMFAPHLNIPEDPATGSANVALIGLLAKLRPEANLSLSKTIAQGVEMGRPSILQATAEKHNGIVTATFIGGRCVPVMSGTIDLV
jgi:trans-2,3-dihydro-3-hydroxyanthranilate isomerase